MFWRKGCYEAMRPGAQRLGVGLRSWLGEEGAIWESRPGFGRGWGCEECEGGIVRNVRVRL